MIEYDLTPDAIFWACRWCRTHVGRRQDCIFVLPWLGTAYFRNIMNVVIDGPRDYQEIRRNIIAVVKCGNSNCRRALGWKYIQADTTVNFLRNGRIALLLSSVLVWDGIWYRPYRPPSVQNVQQNVIELGQDGPVQSEESVSSNQPEPAQDDQNHEGNVHEPAQDENNREGNAHEVAQDDQNHEENVDELSPEQQIGCGNADEPSREDQVGGSGNAYEPGQEVQNVDGKVSALAKEDKNGGGNADEPAENKRSAKQEDVQRGQ